MKDSAEQCQIKNDIFWLKKSLKSVEAAIHQLKQTKGVINYDDTIAMENTESNIRKQIEFQEISLKNSLTQEQIAALLRRAYG